MEKRKWERKACLQRCTIFVHSLSDKPLPSRALNCSLEGVMLETETYLRRGEPVVIRLHHDKDRQDVHRIGTVRWCTPNPQPFSGLYEAGIEVPNPATVEGHGWFARY